MTTLIEWLRARLDDDEREWAGSPDVHERDCEYILDNGYTACDCGWPIRVLAEAKAKRAVLDAYEAAIVRAAHAKSSLPDSQDWIDSAEASRDAWGEAVDLLAQPYADCEGWDEAWRVQE